MANNFTNPGSLVASFAKCCDIFLKDGINMNGVEGKIIMLPQAEIITFDLIGCLVDWDDFIVMIPWGNVAYVVPNLQGKEGKDNA